MASAMAMTNWNNPAGAYTGEKYGTINYADITSFNFTRLRKNSRGTYFDSTIARGIITRLRDNVINTGLAWESTPLWHLIKSAPEKEEDRYTWTKYVESLWKLYAISKEADIEGKLTFQQLQRKIFGLRKVDGELFGILRYLNDPRRLSPLAIQIIKPDQVINPYSISEIEAIKKRGGTVRHGIEKDSVGQIVAIHVRDENTRETVRIPMFGKNRRFVIHFGNFEAAGQDRGFPELSTLVYELKRLTDYSIAELEAVISQGVFAAMFEAEKGAPAGKAPRLNPNVKNRDDSPTAPKAGIEKVSVDKYGLIINKMEPGYTFKGFSPTRPNQNFEKFFEVFETYICGVFGMPRSVFAQKFGSSYSAARAEILFFWNTVMCERADFISGFNGPFHEAWFSEQVGSGKIQAPGFEVPMIHNAWLYGYWSGISRPVVDPEKEVKAVEKRIRLGHTTGEREARAYNGSDFRENVERLKTENEHLAEANKFLDPVKDEPNIETDKEDNGDE